MGLAQAYKEEYCIQVMCVIHLTIRQQGRVVYLTIRQRGRVVYELIVNEGAARVDYLFRDNEAELSN